MEQTYQYAWIISFVPIPTIILIGLVLMFIPTAAKNARRMWAFPSVSLLSIVMIISTDLSIQQINGGYVYQYLCSWIINNDFSFEFGYLIDPLTSIMSTLITTVGIMVLIYSDNYMSHDQGYLRFFTSMGFFTISMLGLVTSTNLVQIYIFWELVGMCSYLLIGFWFTRPIAANACQKAFVTNRVGDFGLLLGILGFFWITGSFEFRELFEMLNNLISNGGVNSFFVTLCAFLLFVGAVAKSAQFPLHVWLPDAMEGPTPISALIHAATMVAAGVFLVARLFPLFRVIPHIMGLISFIGIITVLLGATLSLAQRDIKGSLAYSTMSQLGYIMLALGIGSYRAALFHLITHAYSKALLFLGSGSVIHSMESIVGYSPDKSQNMVLMGGLTKYVPITKSTFYVGTLSLCGIPPLACFWSKDEILNDSWLYSPVFAIIACSVAGLTAFYMFRIYLLTFEGHLRVQFQNYSGTKNGSLYSIPIWGKEGVGLDNKNLLFLAITNNERLSFFSNKVYQMGGNVRNSMQVFSTHSDNKDNSTYPHESDNTILLPLLVLFLFTLFVGSIGISFEQLGMSFDILSKLLTPPITFLQKKIKYSVDWYEFVTTNSIFSVSIACFGIFVASLFYGSVYSSFQNLDLINSFVKKVSNRIFSDQITSGIYSWSYNRGYIDVFYTTFVIGGIRELAQLTHFFDKWIIDGITNSVGITTFFVGEGIKYVGGGRISSYLFIFLSCVLCIRLFFYFFFFII
uniref:NADH-plastoquinone oxidoreductase subunit 5 n=1 Tax=Goniothalamus tamirensis TaxID=553657 RepID=UPI0022FDA0A8|nr:NADH-plastoquinone oxidoreductase subunit 5 [Goniothalamus tamirensis]WBF98367.1 NADH-plastoquinone oxidoreductase subunit 5 [Goniothalamus tamirensis]